MGGRGSASGISDKGKRYGTEYTTVLQSGNIKFVKKNEGSASAPMETRSKGRIYVTIGSKNELKSISFYDSENERYQQIDLSHTHYINGEKRNPHVHLGYEHNEFGDRGINTKEKELIEKVKKIWYNRRNK